MMKAILYVVFVFAAYVMNQAGAQDDTEDSLMRHLSETSESEFVRVPYICLDLNANGAMSQGTGSTEYPNDAFALAVMLRTEEVRNELSISDRQDKKISKLLKDIDQSLEDFKKARKAGLKWRDKLSNTPVDDQLDNILLSHQLRRLKEMRMRFFGRMIGYRRLSGYLIKKDGRSLTATEEGKLKKMGRIVGDQLAVESQKIYEELVLQIEKLLAEPQRVKLRMLTKGNRGLAKFPEVLIYQLRSHENTKTDVDSDHLYADWQSSVKCFFYSDVGFEMSSKKFGRSYGMLTLCFQAMNGQLAPGMDLAEDQKNQIRMVVKSLMKEGAKGPVADSVVQSAEKQFKDIVLPFQVEKLKIERARFQISKDGLVSALTAGRAGRIISLKENQKDKLAKVAEELASKFEKRTRKAENDAIAKMISCLDDENAKLVKKAIGKSLQQSPGYIGIAFSFR